MLIIKKHTIVDINITVIYFHLYNKYFTSEPNSRLPPRLIGRLFGEEKLAGKILELYIKLAYFPSLHSPRWEITLEGDTYSQSKK